MRVTESLLKHYKSELEFCKTNLQKAIKNESSIQDCDELITRISIFESKIASIQHNSHFLSKEDIAEAKTWGQ
tara:strand:+ start:7599 stop:7817 length:219 start_codon:yes stop_codon:yes gene_type:complete